MQKTKLIFSAAAALFLLVSTAFAADTYKIDPVHSNALFEVRHLTVNDFIGRFNGVSGTIVFDGENASNSSVEVEIDANSVDTHSQRRDGHIKSPDFLNAAQFPKLTFKSSSVEKTGDNTYQVSGDLTIRGVTKPLSVEVVHVGSADTRMGYRSGFSASFTVNRRDFNVNYGSKEIVSDELTITLNIESVRQ